MSWIEIFLFICKMEAVRLFNIKSDLPDRFEQTWKLDWHSWLYDVANLIKEAWN